MSSIRVGEDAGVEPRKIVFRGDRVSFAVEEGRTAPKLAEAFVEEFLKAHGVTKANAVREELARYGHGDGEAVQVAAPLGSASASPAAGADFAWHLRAWGRRALAGARRALAAHYPTYAEFEPVRRKGRGRSASSIPLATVRYRHRLPKLLEADEDGQVSVASLNAEFDSFHTNRTIPVPAEK